MPVTGFVPPIPTPMRNGALDVTSLERLVQALAPNVAGYLVGGSVGEHPSLTVEERLQALQVVASCKEPRHSLVVSIGDNALPNVRRLAESARLNYRHAFHAGNFADVVKHGVLARILVYLNRKAAPYRFLDTHAGAGRYDLTSAEARRSPEWREGVGRLLTASPPPAVAELLAPYIEALGPHDRGAPLSYPGSPAITPRPTVGTPAIAAIRESAGYVVYRAGALVVYGDHGTGRSGPL